MSAPRIRPVEAPYENTISDMFARVMPPGRQPLKLFRTMARNPRVLQRMFAGGLLDKGTIGLRERELIILRTCARCGSEYEWGVHVAFFSTPARLNEKEIAATLPGSHENLTDERDMLLLRLVDELHENANISNALWRSLAAAFSEEQLLELIMLTGYYHTVSFLANGLLIEKEDYAPSFASSAMSDK